MRFVYILPTGDEIKSGIVLDIDSPEIMGQILKTYPQAKVCRICPINDDEHVILEVLQDTLQFKPDLVVLIGGSGGGHRFSKTLGKDFTHSALQVYLDEQVAREIYGKNGHLWCKLVCGKKGSTLIINVPGPYVEAKAAFSAFIQAFTAGKNLDEINLAMTKAVYAQYPPNTVS